MSAWRLLPELGYNVLRFDSEADVRKHLRAHYPDRKATDVRGLYRIPTGGWVHVWEEGGPDDDRPEETTP